MREHPAGQDFREAQPCRDATGSRRARGERVGEMERESRHVGREEVTELGSRVSVESDLHLGVGSRDVELWVNFFPKVAISNPCSNQIQNHPDYTLP